MDLNKNASQPKSPDAKMEAGLTSSKPVNIKAEIPSIAEADALVAHPVRARGARRRTPLSFPKVFVNGNLIASSSGYRGTVMQYPRGISG